MLEECLAVTSVVEAFPLSKASPPTNGKPMELFPLSGAMCFLVYVNAAADASGQRSAFNSTFVIPSALLTVAIGGL